MTIAEPRGALDMIAAAREVLLAHGLSESHAPDQDGFYFTVGDGAELAIHLHRCSDGDDAERGREGDRLALLLACVRFARDGYAITLVMSSRTLLLQLRAY